MNNISTLGMIILKFNFTLFICRTNQEGKSLMAQVLFVVFMNRYKLVDLEKIEGSLQSAETI